MGWFGSYEFFFLAYHHAWKSNGINLTSIGLIVPPKPIWLVLHNWIWAKVSEFSRLLGSAFGLNSKTWDVDQFLINKIFKKNLEHGETKPCQDGNYC